MATSLCSKPVGNQYIAIDFGTTRTRVAVMEENTVKVIQNIPSLVSMTEKNELIIGIAAKEMVVTDPTRVYEIKRLLGRRFDDPETQNEMKMLPYKMVRGPNGQAWIEANGRAHNPTEIVASFLVKLKKDAELYLGKSVSDALITYPSEWHAEQFGALIHAGLLARLDEQGAIMATMAAALSYDLIKTEGQTIAVVILGGRTCDVSILKVSDGKYEHIASRHDARLGGNDFDNVLVEFLVDEFKKTEAIDLTTDKSTLQRLIEAAEKAKIELSSTIETVIDLPFLTSDLSGAKHLNITLTRLKFESLVNNLIERTRIPCEICLKRAGITSKGVDEVLLVGGMARVPKLQKVVAEIFGKDPTLSTEANPDEAVVVGAAAAVRAGHLPANFYACC
ncbi:hypothetical protein AQUCO_01300926v1 [Aquilegia coerulea]|uniref:Uncharacterized protein n=1 Tax=Aquilegia coerulea TaxID=218851 RepID=A0A2G5E409_AQUCA|nr:hypothetical protein AQUCO_01300926v1 [Aquilegia coerulea]